MSEALLFVLAEPGRVPEPAFHDWYDHDHGPARLAIPGIRSGYRYRALDEARPTWLAWYETDLATLASPEYLALRERRSPGDRAIIPKLDALDRRVYELVDDHGHPAGGPPPVVVCTSLSTVDEEELDAWYVEEHIPMLHEMPGWRRTRRYRLVAGVAPTRLAFHEISSVELFTLEAYRRATGTPRRDRVMRAVTHRERRVLGYHNTVHANRGSA
jgi:hypothetical protein